MMRKSLWMGVALTVLLTGGATAQEMKFAPGEDSRFNWQSFDDF